jgi:methionyl-tRNA formyltransferase
MRVIFMGTPEFAVPSLRLLVERATPGDLAPDGLQIVGVMTRVDKPSGRGRQVVHSPVKQVALEAGLPVYQPGPLRRPESLALLTSLAPDLIVVAAFGQILPSEVIHLPARGCLNIHASLLPRHRGAAPIAAAILASDAETGVTIMQMDEGLDTGPILTTRATPIGPEETAGELTARLAGIGAALLGETLPGWLAGAITPIPQDESRATMTRLLRKEDGLLDWTQPADLLARQVRACTPWPGAYTFWNGQQLKVMRAHVVDPGVAGAERRPGECFLLPGTQPTLAVACGAGALALAVVQLQGKRAMPVDDLLRGYPALATARFQRAPESQQGSGRVS